MNGEKKYKVPVDVTVIGDSTKEWDEAFRPVMQKWLSEEVDIETKIFSQEECADLISSNPDLRGSAIDIIVSALIV